MVFFKTGDNLIKEPSLDLVDIKLTNLVIFYLCFIKCCDIV